METIKIRIKSSRYPYRRAGFVFAAARQWQEETLEGWLESARRLLELVCDPVLVIECWDGDEWCPAPSADDLREMITAYEAYVAPTPEQNTEGAAESEAGTDGAAPAVPVDLASQPEASEGALTGTQPDTPPASAEPEEVRPIAEADSIRAPAPTPAPSEGDIMPASESQKTDGSLSVGDDAPAPEADVPANEAPEVSSKPPPASAPQTRTRQGKGK